MTQDSAKPAHGQQVITAVAALYCFVDGTPQVMLAKRAETKRFLPEKYELPGGHIDFGESLEAGLTRELHEELSIDVTLESPFAAFTYLNEVKGSHSVEIVFLGTINGGKDQITLDSDEHSQILWVDRTKINLVTEVNGVDDPELPILKAALTILEQRS